MTAAFGPALPVLLTDAELDAMNNPAHQMHAGLLSAFGLSYGGVVSADDYIK